MSGHNWTMQAVDIERLAKLADQIEIEACRDVGGFTERCDVASADFYSVYFHYAPQSDPNALQGVECIADRETEKEARAIARTLSAQFSLSVYGETGKEL